MKKEFIYILVCLILILPLASSQNASIISNLNIDKILNLNSTVPFPSFLQLPTQLIFGVTGEISWQIFILLATIWLILLIIIYKLVVFIPFFEDKKAIKIIVSILIACLIGTSGAIKETSISLLNFVNIFNILEKSQLIALVIAIIIAIIFFIGANILIKIISKESETTKAEKKGEKVKTMIEMAEAQEKAIKEAQKERKG